MRNLLRRLEEEADLVFVAAKRDLTSGKHPNLGVQEIAGDFWLVDSDNGEKLLKSFKTAQYARDYRTKKIDLALRKLK